MFTGIIRCTGKLVSVRPLGAGRTIVVSAPELVSQLAEGSSVAVNGVCLTVTGVLTDSFQAHAGAETYQRTTLGQLAPGALVNLEPALRVGDELGGHLVQGHVDGIGRLVSALQQGETIRLRFGAGPELLQDMVVRGSVAVDGISLTITALDDDGFQVAIIPYTWRNTNLHALSPGDRVNIETDIIAKYVRRFLARQGAADTGTLTREFLAEHGYL